MRSTSWQKKIEDETHGTWSKYGDIVKSMQTTQAGDRSKRKPAFKTPSHAQAMDGRRLKSEEAMKDVTPANPDLSTNHSDLMEINNRYILLTIYSLLSC